MYGGPSRDILKGLDGDDHLDGRQPISYSRAVDEADWLFGGRGNDTMSGGPGNDWLEGGADDRLFGDVGDDWLDGGAGTDTAEFIGSRAD